jgi:hypothetical protein
MALLRSIADIVGRLAALIIGVPVEPERAPTEDDLASERFFARQRGVSTR